MQKFIDQHVKSGSDELRWYPLSRKYDVRLDRNNKWEITIYDKKGKTQTVPLYEYNSGMGLYYFVLNKSKKDDVVTKSDNLQSGLNVQRDETKQEMSEPIMVQDFFC